MNFTLEEWVEYWLKTYKIISVKPSTFESYLFCLPLIRCSVPFSELRGGDVQRIISDMAVAGYATSSINHVRTLIRQALVKAQQLGYIANLSALENLEMPPKRARTVNGLDKLELRHVLRNTHKTLYGDFYRFLIYSGCRVGEAIALTWGDIDFFTRSMRINKTDYRGKIQSTKTTAGERTIPLYGELFRVIMRQKRGKPSERVFLNSLGRPINYRTLLDSWHRFTLDIGIYNRSVGLHMLRHTFAHRAIREGIPVKVVSAWLGHADVGVTLKIYDTVDREDFRKAAEKLAAMSL